MPDNTSARLLNTAAALVDGDRKARHGANKLAAFAATAALWNAYLMSREDPDDLITARDVAWMMVLLKISRSNQGDQSFDDHYVDACGYAAIAGEISIDRYGSTV